MSFNFIYGTDGNNVINGTGVADYVEARGGNDTVNGSAGDDFLQGQDGDDQLDGGTGADRVYGGEGNDFIASGGGADDMRGGGGDDIIRIDDIAATYIDGNNGNDIIFFNFSGSSTGVRLDFTFLFGAPGLTANGTGRVGRNLPGNPEGYRDFVGADVLGIEIIRKFIGSNHDDYFYVGNMSTDLRGPGFDVGAEGSTGVEGRDGNDILIGGNGNDSMNGNVGNDLLRGGNGGDRLAGDFGDDLVDGDAGNDIIFGDSGNDILNGNADNDDLRGGSGADTLDGGTGDDLLNGEAGADMMNGGEGSDRFIVDDEGDLVIDTGAIGTDVIVSSISSILLPDGIENLEIIAASSSIGREGLGNELNNRLTGSIGQDNLFGAGGNDVIDGALSDDVIYGGAGDDVLNGGEGNDVLTDAEGINQIDGGAGDDFIQLTFGTLGNDGQTVATGGVGADIFKVGRATRLSEQDRITDFDPAAGDRLSLQGVIDGFTDASFAYWPVGGLTLLSGVPLFFRGVLAESAMTHGSPLPTLNIGIPALQFWTVQSGGNTFVVGDSDGDGIFENNDFTLRLDGLIAITLDSFVAGTFTALVGTDLADAAVSFATTSGADHAFGLAGNDVVLGGDGDDWLYGNEGNDILDGEGGSDVLYGGLGDDLYRNVTADDYIVESGGEGIDTVETAIDLSLPGGIDFLVMTGTADINANGNNLANRMIGNSGNNALDGFGGADTLQGLAGDDIYFVDDVNDRVVETVSLAAGATDDAGGVDAVWASISYSIDTASNVRFVENLVLEGSANINGTGNALANEIVGNRGNNILDGGIGDDLLRGMEGNDIYLLDGIGDVVQEAVNGGTDTIRAAFTIAALSANVENLELQGIANINGTGNGENNAITGNSGKNRLEGLGGNDVLNGGLGADQMLGGAGDDQYFIDNGSDRVFETVTTNAADTTDAGGVDHITTSIAINMNNYNGIRFVENATLTGTANLTLTGNALNNILTGNTGRNTLDGGLGADILRGGRGDDIYIVDNLGDVTDETGGDGIDLIRSSVSWTLGAAFENLELTGTADINAQGNALANRLTGNAGNNQLDGGAGTDTLVGGAGNDTYFIDSSGDRIIETITVSQTATNDAGGFDQILSSVTVFMNSYSSISFVEAATLTGSALTSLYGNARDNLLFGNNSANTLDGFTGNDQLTGNGGNDTLIGGMGDDTLDGGADRDRLTGGAGQDILTGGSEADTFVFGIGDMGTSQGTADRITDWSGLGGGGQGDRIDLSAIDANSANGSGTNEAFSFIGSAAFSNVAGQLRSEVIGGNTYLMADTNGDGIADLWLRLDGTVSVGVGDLAL